MATAIESRVQIQPVVLDDGKRRRRRIYRRWTFVVILGLFAVVPLFGRLANGSVGAGTQAEKVQTLINRYGPDSGNDFVVVEGAVARPALSGEVRHAVNRMQQVPGVASVQTLRARDADATLISVGFTRNRSNSPPTSALNGVSNDAHAIRGAKVLVGGDDYFGQAAASLAESNLVHGELIGLILAFVVLSVLFGIRGALIPLVAGVTTFCGAFLLLLPLTTLTAIDSNAINIITALGLGLSLDYSLLLVARYRQARAGGRTHAEAMAEARTRAGRTVTWSGLTVVVSLSALLVFSDTPLVSIALGGICATLTAVAVGRTLVPALLDANGPRLRPLRRRTAERGFARLADLVSRQRWATAAAALGLLLLIAVPAFGTRLSELGTSSLPASSQPRAALTAADRYFPQLGTATVGVVAPVAPTSPAARRLAGTLEHVKGIDSVTTSRLGDRTLATATVPGAGNGPEALRVVHEVRALHLPYHVLVGGDAAFQIDHQHALAHRLPYAIALLALATMLLIGLLTRSLGLALLAPLLAALSEGAMLGAVVWAYQNGHLAGLLPMTATGSLVIYVPIVAVAIAYALSLDYLVFVLSRVQEARRAGRTLEEAMKEGLSRTGPVITAAAGLVALVFAGYASGSLLLVQQLGFALGAAVLLDATVVRCLLLPAVVSILARHQRRQPAAVPAARRSGGAAQDQPRRMSAPASTRLSSMKSQTSS